MARAFTTDLDLSPEQTHAAIGVGPAVVIISHQPEGVVIDIYPDEEGWQEAPVSAWYTWEDICVEETDQEGAPEA